MVELMGGNEVVRDVRKPHEELENLTSADRLVFVPAKFEWPFVRPDSRPKLLVDPY